MVEETRFNVVYFFMTMCLQIISFVFLFNFRSTEYIVYIFSFIIFCVSPFVWINDFLAVSTGLNTDSRYSTLFQYKEISLGISSLLIFLGIFLVILTNEKIRKQKVEQKLKAEKIDDWSADKKPAENLNSLKTSDSQEYNSKEILRLYALAVILSWGMVMETFSDSTTFGDKGLTKSGFSEWMRELMNIPHFIVGETDNVIHQQTAGNVSPMIKAFSAYAVTFIVFFFGLFIRIPLSGGRGFDKIHVVNMENIFNPKFFRNIDQNRNVAIFFTCTFISSLLFMFGLLIQKIPVVLPVYVLPIGFVSLTTLLFGSFFGMRHKIDAKWVQIMIMFLLSVLCSLLGTPVIVGMLQFFLEIFGMSLITENSSWLGLGISVVLSFFLIFSFVMYFSLTWINNDASKRIQIFNAVLVCMALSLFMGLSTTYHMFTNLYTFIRGILESLFVYIVPFLVIVVSIVLFALSFKSYQKGLIMTDG